MQSSVVLHIVPSRVPNNIVVVAVCYLPAVRRSATLVFVRQLFDILVDSTTPSVAVNLCS